MMGALKPLIMIALISSGIVAMRVVETPTIFAQQPAPTAQNVAASPTTPESFARSMVEVLAQTLGPLFILGWYLYRHETKTLPDKDKQIADAQSQYQGEMEKARILYQTETQKDRDTHEKTVERLVGQIENHANMVLSIVQKCPGVKESHTA
jgi:hypothetical protein